MKHLDPPPPYSPLMLLGFDEKEYLKELANEDLEKSVEVGGNIDLDATETSMAIDGILDADASPIV